LSAVDAGRLVERALDQPAASFAARIWIVAAGKAAPAMASAALARFSQQVRGGVIVDREGPRPGQPPEPGLERLAGGHPVPTPASERAGRRSLEIAARMGRDDVLLVLLSGGASALMAAPVDSMTLSDKRETTDRLLRAGADIHALNTVRKHLSSIKGGRLAATARGPVVTLAVSDVVGDDPSVIGSGPTVADPSTFVDALGVLERFGGIAAYPPSSVRHLEQGRRGERPETPKPGDPALAASVTHVIGGRHDAMQGAAAEAAKRGYRTVVLQAPVVGDARQAAAPHLAEIHDLVSRAGRPLCVVSSGETTVRVAGTGIGGRNQEFALAASELLPALGAVAAASVGTDGIDGPTDAAGAIADSQTVERARRAGLAAPAAYLDDNNSYAFFESLGDLIRTGPTGTNVGDLQVFLLA
jgi:glycerate-2-kinase